MQDKKTIQNYINNFRRHFSAYLKPGMGLVCKVFPVKSNGALMEFTVGPNVENDDLYMPLEETVNSALIKIEQRMVGGNIDAIWFAGTNISMEKNRIIILKGEDTPSEWCDEGARNDVQRIVVQKPKRK